ncbi:MAG: NAD-dependent epimerase/dehydratase family protein [Patescibacteria group bacterium]
MKYKHVLITGGAGFIGSHLTDHLIENGYKVRILDNLNPQIHPSGKPPVYLNKKAEFIKGNVINRDDLVKALEKIDVVFHLAAAVGVGQSMYQIEHYVRDNCLGTAILLDILANERHTVKKMLVAASMSSFGEGMYNCPKCGSVQQPDLRNGADFKKGIWEPLCLLCKMQLTPIPTDETARLQSPSVYAITKRTQEELLISIGKAYRIPAVSLRFFNAFGSRQSLSNPYNGVAAIFLSRVKNGKNPILNEDGLQTRDFVHIKDLVKVCQLTMESDSANNEIFNVGSGKPTTIREVAKTVLDLCKSREKLEITGKFRTFDVRHCFADVTKLKRLVGWMPSISFKQGMNDVFEWSKNETATDKVDDAMKELETRGLR